MIQRLSFILVSALCLATVACKKKPSGLQYAKSAAMSPQQVVPQPSGVSASGTVTASYDQNTHILNYSLTWTGLSSDSIRLIHVHGPAEAGFNGAILQVNNPRSTSNTAGFPLKAAGNFSNQLYVDNFVVKETELLGNLYYIDIHTKAYPNGELRGQLTIN
jgi:hypothetical protein